MLVSPRQLEFYFPLIKNKSYSIRSILALDFAVHLSSTFDLVVQVSYQNLTERLVVKDRH